MSTETLTETIASPLQPAPARKPGVWPVEAVITIWAFIAAGAYFRIKALCHWRSLWVDEIYLAHSVVSRGMWSLISQPLDKWQIAPPGFLILTRACVDLFGPGERSMRIPSLLAGLATLPLFYFLARKILSLRGTLISVCFFSSLAPMVYFSQELKPYSMEVAVALGVILTAVNCLQNPASIRHVMIFAAVSLAGLFFSVSAGFVIAGCGIALFAGRFATARKSGAPLLAAILPLLLVGLILGGAEALNYFAFYRGLLHSKVHLALVQDWQKMNGFPQGGPNRAAPWIFFSLKNIMAGTYTMYLSAPDLALFAGTIGLGAIISGKKRLLGFILVAPLPVAIIFALARQYPLADRLALYLVPILVIFISAGLDWIWGPGGWGRFSMGLLAILMIVGNPVIRSIYEARYPSGREETRQIYQRIREYWRAGDILLLNDMAAPSFDYYAPRTGMAGLHQLLFPGEDETPILEASAQGEAAWPWLARAFASRPPQDKPLDGYVALLADHSQNDALYLDDVDYLFRPPLQWNGFKVTRVWVVYTHTYGNDVDTITRGEFNRVAQESFKINGDGAQAYLYEVSATPSAYLKP